MSTKIYNGLRIKYMTMQELIPFSKELRAQLEPIAKEEFLKSYTKMLEEAIVFIQTGVQIDSCIHNYNELSALENPTFKDVNRVIDKEIRQFIKTNKSATTITESVSAFDFDTSLCVFPLSRKILSVPICNNERLMNALLENENITAYGYWNNTDKPDNVSNREWNTRKSDWDKALPGIGVLRENGFIFDLIDTMWDAYDFVYNVETIYPFLTDVNTLISRVAKSKLLSEKYNEFRKEESANESYPGMRTYFKARDYVRDHPDEVENMKNSFSLDVKGFLAK